MRFCFFLFCIFISATLFLCVCACVYPFCLSVYVLFANPNAFHLFTFIYFVVILCIASLFCIVNNEKFIGLYSQYQSSLPHGYILAFMIIEPPLHLSLFPFVLIYLYHVMLEWIRSFLLHIFISNFHHRIQSLISCTICCHSVKYI